MLHLTADTKIFLAVGHVDFRKYADGLITICQRQLGQDPRSGGLFAFINRSRTMIRVLSYHDGGYWVATKRLSRGRFLHWPRAGATLDIAEASRFVKILKGAIVNEKEIL